MITNEIFSDYLSCTYKAYCKMQGQQEKVSEYEALQEEREEQYKNQVITLLRKRQKVKTVCFKNTVYSCPLYLVEDKGQHYIPILFKRKTGISQSDKLLLAFYSYLIELLYGQPSMYGKIVTGKEFHKTTIQVTPYKEKVKKIINHLKNLTKETLQRDDYCWKCNFCTQWAKETDDLTLLKGISRAEIKRLHAKGIFTVTQFSYVFRPKKRRIRVKEYTRSYIFELKALALREKKVLVYEKRELPQSPVHIYFDIEGNEDNTFHYLIGLIIKKNSDKKVYSFWANTQDEEEKILQKFLQLCLMYSNVTLFHYGSYETNFLKQCKKKYQGKYDKEIDKLLGICVNIVSFIYAGIFFPTYTNELKDIGNYLDCKWSEKNASGLQSIVWRSQWEQTYNKKWKEILLRYNTEDCLALKTIVEFLYTITNSSESAHTDTILWTENIEDETNYGFGKPTFFFPELAYINKCAYFNYQREKVFFRTSKKVKQTSSIVMKKKKIISGVDATVTIESPLVCPSCNNKKLLRRTRYNKIVYDLKFFPGGIKKWTTRYTTVSVKCSHCQKESIAKEYKNIHSKYGQSLMSYVVYQIIANGVSLEKISQNLSDLFSLSLASSTLYSFKTIVADFYKDTYQHLSQNILHGALIHADETKVNLKKTASYVWVFTNMEEVIFIHKESREGNFLKDFLAEFKGVLVTDYYAGYDNLPFPQQKCLIHLIRDLNRDLFRNQFDEELKMMVQQFSKLLQNIIQTIDTHGLQKRFLKKHKKEVALFLKNIQESTYTSEFAKAYQKRFEKNKNKLFTFLDYDNIPWNNNNAEHAFKHFATYRKMNNGIFTQSGIEDYLILLSIYQTCQYKSINFLEFLLSGKRFL